MESIIDYYYHTLIGLGIFNMAYNLGVTLARQLGMYQDHYGEHETEIQMKTRHSKLQMLLDGARLIFFGLIAPLEFLYGTLSLCRLRCQRNTFTSRQTRLMEDFLLCYSDLMLETALFFPANKIILRIGRRFGFYQDHTTEQRGATTTTTHKITATKSEIQIFLDGSYAVFLGLHIPTTLWHEARILYERYRADSSSVIEHNPLHDPDIWLQLGIVGLAYGISVALARRWGLYQDSGDRELKAACPDNADRMRTLPRPEYPIDGRSAAEPILIE
ncbi:MAG: hypothetical protein Q9184_008177 [Pyrenodesmia sp. 2 TL-2023]